jgi:hypothetical protein
VTAAILAAVGGASRQRATYRPLAAATCRSSKLPQLGEGLGTAIKSFKRAITSADEIDVTPKKSEIPGEQPKPGPAQSSQEAPKP